MGVPDKCPRCGCTVATSRERPMGTICVLHNLETGEVDCSIMYESLTSEGKWLYCNDCGKRVCTIAEFIEKFEIERSIQWDSL